MVVVVLPLALGGAAVQGPWRSILIFFALVMLAVVGVMVALEDHLRLVTLGRVRASGRICLGLMGVGLTLLVASWLMPGVLLGLVCFAYGLAAVSAGVAVAVLWFRTRTAAFG
jgi:hypothetical protein